MYLILSRILDTVHTILIWLSLWNYLIGNYGKVLYIVNADWYGIYSNFARYKIIDKCTDRSLAVRVLDPVDLKIQLY